MILRIESNATFKSLTHSIGEEDILDTDVPSLVFAVGALNVGFGWLREGIGEHELALSLEPVSDVGSEEGVTQTRSYGGWTRRVTREGWSVGAPSYFENYIRLHDFIVLFP